jgi:NADH-quinone oxidoreductase subunit H
MGGAGVVGSAIAGYGSDNKFSLLGGLRAASQMVSYEVVLGLALVGCFVVYDSLLLEDMVQWQIDHVWGVFVQPVALVLYLAGSTAEMKRIPFDAPEAESELVGGYILEFSSLKWLLFKMGEYFEVVLASIVITVLFFGGYHLPGLTREGIDLFGWQQPLPHLLGILVNVAVFVVKVAVVVWAQFVIRWTLPRFRYDQIMKLCWRYMLPLALVNIFATAVVVMLIQG